MIENTVRITVALHATNQLVKTKRERQTLVTLVPGNTFGTNAIARFGMAHRRRWTITLATIGEPVVASSTNGTISTNHIRLAVALATKRFTLVIIGPIDVTLTRQGTPVESNSHGEYGRSTFV